MDLRRFRIKDEKKIEALQSLIAKKNLSKDDLVLILSTIEIQVCPTTDTY